MNNQEDTQNSAPFSDSLETLIEKKTRLDILKNSLEKKKQVLDSRYDAYFEDVKRGNGQPMNDKRNGQATLNRWDRKSNSIRSAEEAIKVTEEAIIKHEYREKAIERTKSILPAPLLDSLTSGDIRQWHRFPNYFFVKGVEKGRFFWDTKTKCIRLKYMSQIPNKEQKDLFISVVRQLDKDIRDLGAE